MKTSRELQIEAGRSRYVVPCLITLLVALAFWPGSAFAQSTSAPLLTTFTNPTPAVSDSFGFSLAAFGSDQVLIGMNDYKGNGGAAYLFSVSGALTTTFTNPIPVKSEGFGFSVAAVGNDRVLIGARYGNANAGAAYLFNTNGTLLTTFTNPIAGGTSFGWSVTAVGSNRVLIGAPGFVSGVEDVGAAFLFSTNGALLNTFTNPTPAAFDNFGSSVAALGGGDRVLIGAYGDNTGAQGAGVVYLFSTNGALQTTITNPVPATFDSFGFSVAAIGNNRVLIGSLGATSGAMANVGAAYLFSTNGMLLTTFTNPTPAANDNFGWAVSSVGSTRVLIGAYGNNVGAQAAGSAYLFGTNGTWLTTINNPTPAASDWFGISVAALGGDRVLIGAQWDDTGAKDAGSAYLFDLPYPPLSIVENSATVTLSWVTPETGLNLQQTDLLGTPTVWSNATDSVSINGLTNVVQPSIANGITNRFYRLHRP